MNLAETTIGSLVVTLTGLVTTGARVYRAFENVDDLPALVIRQGANQVNGIEYGKYSRGLDVSIEANIKKSTTAETQLNQIAAEVFAAMMIDPLQGQTFIESTELTGSNPPAAKNLADSIVTQTINFKINYTHSTKTMES
jgi:hypothetical protein